MANGNGEIRLLMPHSKEKALSPVEHAVQRWRKTARRISRRHENPDDQHILDPRRQFLPEWNTVFVISCVFAVSLDPLFFYVPLISEDMKCLRLDKRLKAISIGLRSLTDLFYIADFMFRIFTKPKAETTSKKIEAVSPKGSKPVHMHVLEEIAKRVFAFAKRILLLLDILAILPVPQVVIFHFILKMSGSRSLKTRKFLISLVLLQYVPRVLLIYLLCNEHKKTPKKRGKWVKGFFNFFLYILASHVIGALWYFFAIQREADCWQYACRSENGCETPSTFNCDDPSFRNITFSNDLCPINPPNVTLFDFGIFSDALQSGILQSTNFPQKFWNCFWWGLRNLSSLGQNLQTSTYAWENIFAVFICITGLLLFLYLIGNLQIYMQFSRATSEKLRQKLKKKRLEVKLWLSENGLPKKMKARIMENVHQKLEENKNVPVDLLILPPEYLSYVKRCLGLAILRKVPKLKDIEGVDELNEICEHFKPRIYPKDSSIIQKGEPLDMILLITQGTVRTYTTSKGGKNDGAIAKSLEKGEFYGEELITSWTSDYPPPAAIPISDRFVRCLTKVEAFVLTAEDLKSHLLPIYFWRQFIKGNEHNRFNEIYMVQLREQAAKSIQRAFRRYNKMKKHTAS